MKKLYTLIIIFVLGICIANGQKPVANFSASKDSMCENDCISFFYSSTNSPASWLWTFTGGSPSSSTDRAPQFVCYQIAGSYDVSLIVSNSYGSDTIVKQNYITVVPSPPTPIITQSGDTLFCRPDPSYIFYRWYDSTTVVSWGAADTFLVITHAGNYNVQVANSNCCLVAAGINQWGGDTFGLRKINVVSNYLTGSNPCGFTDGIKNLSTVDLVSVFPNPSADYITIRSSSFKLNQALKIYIVNVLGENVLNENMKWNDEEKINIENLPSGVFFIKVINEYGKWIEKFIKQ